MRREDIRVNDLRTPILVSPDPVCPARYQLVEGRMRLEVALREGWHRIPAVVEAMSADEAVARVMSSEFATWARRSALERAWMASDAKHAYAVAGVSDSLSSLSQR